MLLVGIAMIGCVLVEVSGSPYACCRIDGPNGGFTYPDCVYGSVPVSSELCTLSTGTGFYDGYVHGEKGNYVGYTDDTPNCYGSAYREDLQVTSKQSSYEIKVGLCYY